MAAQAATLRLCATMAFDGPSARYTPGRANVTNKTEVGLFGTSKVNLLFHTRAQHCKHSRSRESQGLVMLGKRKRETRIVSRRKEAPDVLPSEQSSSTDASDVFRKHFEATFAPLPEDIGRELSMGEDSDEVSDTGTEVSEWSGLSESSKHLPEVEIVNHETAQNEEDDELARARQKSFMSTKPPRELQPTHGSEKTKTLEADDSAERLNLKHDLDLQRLLKESHLLEKSRASGAPGKQRQMAFDMRLQALGAKHSVTTQQNMPRAHRIGISKKADQRDTKRRQDAKENGVILEKATKKPSKTTRRDRSVDNPGVGKFAGGTLKLSRRDVASIQGSPSIARRKGKTR